MQPTGNKIQRKYSPAAWGAILFEFGRRENLNPRLGFIKPAACQPKSLPLPTRKAAWARPPPPSTWPLVLAAVGRRVLLFDLDPQANATSGVGLEKIEGASAYHALLGQGGLLDKIQRTAFERLEIIPSEVDLCGADIELPRSDNHLQRVAQAMQPVLESQRFDVVLVDCPPSLGILTLNAFAAADGVLVPLQCEYYALEGISMLNRVMAQLHDKGINPRLELTGVVMTMFDGRTRLSQQVVG